MDGMDRLERDVHTLAAQTRHEPGKNRRDRARAASYVSDRFGELGYVPAVDRFRLQRRGAGHRQVDVLVAEHPGDAAGHRTLVVGARYASHPCDNDEATGVAILLSLAERLRGRALARTVRLVAFPSEPPAFRHTDQMGSWVYARRCRDRGDCIDGMISVEDLGHHGGSRLLDFFAVVSNLSSRKLAHRLYDALGPHPRVGARCLVAPGFLPPVRSSDHWSFWQEGWPAVMLTDGARLRHGPDHRPEVVDFGRLRDVANAVSDAVIRLASERR